MKSHGELATRVPIGLSDVHLRPHNPTTAPYFFLCLTVAAPLRRYSWGANAVSGNMPGGCRRLAPACAGQGRDHTPPATANPLRFLRLRISGQHWPAWAFATGTRPCRPVLSHRDSQGIVVTQVPKCESAVGPKSHRRSHSGSERKLPQIQTDTFTESLADDLRSDEDDQFALLLNLV